MPSKRDFYLCVIPAQAGIQVDRTLSSSPPLGSRLLGIAGRIVWPWVLTIPFSAVTAALAFYVIRFAYGGF